MEKKKRSREEQGDEGTKKKKTNDAAAVESSFVCRPICSSFFFLSTSFSVLPAPKPKKTLSQARRSFITYVPSVGDAKPRTITLIPGDGIGPEISAAVEEVVEALGAPVEWERFPGVSGSTPRGEPVTEVPADVLASIRRNKVCFKGTLFTPLSEHNTSTQSLNVQLRKALDLHVNLCHGFNTPGVPSRFEGLDIVVIRENTEGEKKKKKSVPFFSHLFFTSFVFSPKLTRKKLN